MEIIEKKVVIKLDQEERESLINTITLLEDIRTNIPCEECPFKKRCDMVSQSECLLFLLARDLKYINNLCD